MDSGTDSYNRFLNGDENGLYEIVKLYSDNLIFFINNIINNLDVAEDIMEDTFAKLISKKCKFRGEASFKTYLFRMAKNNAINYLRKNKKYNLDENKEIDNIEDIKNLENLVIRKEDMKQIHTYLENLNNDYRNVMHLIYFEEMSYEQISKVLNKNVKQIKNIAYRARKSLKDMYIKEGLEYEGI